MVLVSKRLAGLTGILQVEQMALQRVGVREEECYRDAFFDIQGVLFCQFTATHPLPVGQELINPQ